VVLSAKTGEWSVAGQMARNRLAKMPSADE